jgi:hypothetical protein
LNGRLAVVKETDQRGDGARLDHMGYALGGLGEVGERPAGVGEYFIVCSHLEERNEDGQSGGEQCPAGGRLTAA